MTEQNEDKAKQFAFMQAVTKYERLSIFLQLLIVLIALAIGVYGSSILILNDAQIRSAVLWIGIACILATTNRPIMVLYQKCVAGKLTVYRDEFAHYLKRSTKINPYILGAMEFSIAPRLQRQQYPFLLTSSMSSIVAIICCWAWANKMLTKLENTPKTFTIDYKSPLFIIAILLFIVGVVLWIIYGTRADVNKRRMVLESHLQKAD